MRGLKHLISHIFFFFLMEEAAYIIEEYLSQNSKSKKKIFFLTIPDYTVLTIVSNGGGHAPLSRRSLPTRPIHR